MNPYFLFSLSSEIDLKRVSFIWRNMNGIIDAPSEPIIKIKKEDRETGYYYRLCELISYDEREKEDLLKKITEDIQKHAGEGIAHVCYTALLEALNNALYHGNLGFMESNGNIEERVERLGKSDLAKRRVAIIYFRAEDKLFFNVTDEGGGFEVEKYRNKDIPTKELCRTNDCGGLGIRMIDRFMDKIWYNKKGNSISMKKAFEKKEDYQ